MGRISINGFPKWTSCGKYIRTVMATFGGTIFLGWQSIDGFPKWTSCGKSTTGTLVATFSGTFSFLESSALSGKFSVPPVVTF